MPQRHRQWSKSVSVLCLCVTSSIVAVTSSIPRPSSALPRLHAGVDMDEHMQPLPQRERKSKIAKVEAVDAVDAAQAAVESTASIHATAAAPAAMVVPATIDIDGSMLEGGGQIIRICSALSALLGTPVRMDKIRAGRSKGGLAAQHAAGLKLVGQICSATLEGASVGSTTATMWPVCV